MALAAVLLLAGCSATPAASPSPTATAKLDKQLIAVMPSTLDATTAQTETVRLANAIQALIPTDLVLHTDDHSQLVAKTDGSGGSYYAVLRAISLQTATDPNAYANALVAALIRAGWVERTTSSGTTNVLTALQSSRSSTPWIVLVGGDSSVTDQSVVSLQLASPDLP
ncbi:MAG: hypothetical protein JWN80_1971 [Microbacteriaceae bacterium]|jgi:hypothetical protein|nr:hypothetical protein [Microbacteriaceae bacterium]